MQAVALPTPTPQLEPHQITAAHLPFPNGAVLDARRGRAHHLAVVLARFPDLIVVWTVNLQDAHRARRGGFYSGSYFDPSDGNAEKAARAEFRNRW